MKVGLPLIDVLAKLGGTNASEEIMLARRGLALAKLSKSISCCISTTEAVLETYDTFTDGRLGYVPVLVNTDALNKRKEDYKNAGAVFFSGRMTKYRRAVLDKLLHNQLNSYPLLSLHYFPKADEEHAYLLSLSKKRLGSLSEMLVGNSAAHFLKAPQLRVIEKISDSSSDDCFELYIPQDKNWPFSSPNRTLLSLETGFIPVDYGDFHDHDINAVTYKISSGADLLQITNRDFMDLLDELLDRVTAYNNGQAVKAQKFRVFLEEVFALHGQR